VNRAATDCPTIEAAAMLLAALENARHRSDAECQFRADAGEIPPSATRNAGTAPNRSRNAITARYKRPEHRLAQIFLNRWVPSQANDVDHAIGIIGKVVR